MNTVAAPPRGKGFWLWQVLPPFALLACFVSTYGPTVYFSLSFGVLVVLWSLGSLVVRLVRLVFRRGDPRRLVRPVLAIVLVMGPFAYVQKSLEQARDVITREAQRIQADCERAGRCPDGLAIGTGEDGTRRVVATPSTHLRWPLTYRSHEDGTFAIYLHEGIDTSRVWSGGTDTTLTYMRVDDGRETPLPLGGDGPAVFPDE